MHNYVDLGIAVDLDYQGCIVPVIRDAETKRLRAIAREINDLAGRARSRRSSTPDEISGGTFTISNNGSAGIGADDADHQPAAGGDPVDRRDRPQAGRRRRRPTAARRIAIHPVGNLAMAWDHRAFDGAYAAGFLVQIKEILETRDWSAEL